MVDRRKAEEKKMTGKVIPNRRWGNKYKGGYTKVTMKSFNKQNKKCECAAQKIRYYFDTTEWYKIKRKNV